MENDQHAAHADDDGAASASPVTRSPCIGTDRAVMSRGAARNSE